VGAALNESTAWTILAPNDQAFEAALQQLGLTNTSILEEAQRVSGGKVLRRARKGLLVHACA
jgi:hypothetical protein